MNNGASRICQSCGLCCNGVMFHSVRLQEADVPQALVALGLRVRRKKGYQIIQQPCPAHKNSCCSIYLDRPQRCRLFECQQLRRLAQGEIQEIDALAKIRDVQERVARIEVLLLDAGTTDPRRPLSRRFEKIMAEPLHSYSDEKTFALHADLTREMKELDSLLDEEFRIPTTQSTTID